MNDLGRIDGFEFIEVAREHPLGAVAFVELPHLYERLLRGEISPWEYVQALRTEARAEIAKRYPVVSL